MEANLSWENVLRIIEFSLREYMYNLKGLSFGRKSFV